MKDEYLADEIITRLNKLCEDPEVRKVISLLLEKGRVVATSICEHPTIQVASGSHNSVYTLGFIGLLNGLVGIIESGEKEGCGYICAHWDGEGEESCVPENFTGFKRVDSPEVKPK